MIVTKIETPFRQFLESLKVPSSPNGKGGTLFSPDEINYLTRSSLALVYEFKQEYETDREFYEMFIKWLHEEEPKHNYYIDAYLIFYLREGKALNEDELKFFEQAVPECFGKGRIWIYELNHRMRFRLRIQLICSLKTQFIRIIKKDIHPIK